MAHYSQGDHKQICQHHEKIIWSRFALLFLGAWLFFTPLTFGYYAQSKMVMHNDMLCGLLIFIFAFFAFSPTSKFFPYLIAIIGIWLNFAPLVFWAPTSTMYLNDTLVGSLVIAFSILIPQIPGESLYQGVAIPKGWDYNPSSWPQRLPTMILAVISWFFARYMAAYQLGYIDQMWDPFFGDQGTIKVITSDLSKSFPISDAGMGAMAYCLEFLLGAKGGVRRWYTMPWLVVCFGILVVPLGVVSILLVCSQPIIVGHWCTWCLAAATCCMFMITFAVNEVIAVGQYIHSECKSGRGWWDVLWSGGTPKAGTMDEKTPSLFQSPGKVFSAMGWGVTLPWNLLVTAACGVWLMTMPATMILNSNAANFDYVMGALVVVCSFISMAEVIRSVRYVIGLVGIWNLAAVWLFQIPVDGSRPWMQLVIGVLMILFCIPKGKVKHSYGSYDKFIF